MCSHGNLKWKGAQSAYPTFALLRLISSWAGKEPQNLCTRKKVCSRPKPLPYTLSYLLQFSLSLTPIYQFQIMKAILNSLVNQLPIYERGGRRIDSPFITKRSIERLFLRFCVFDFFYFFTTFVPTALRMCLPNSPWIKSGWASQSTTLFIAKCKCIMHGGQSLITFFWTWIQKHVWVMQTRGED